jgi:hypothetical protein
VYIAGDQFGYARPTWLKFLHLLNIGGRLLIAYIFDILYNTNDTICEGKMFFSDIRNN